MLRTLNNKWESVKQRSPFLLAIVFFIEIKAIIETTITAIQFLYKNATKVDWHSIIHLPNESWMEFVSKVVLVWMYVQLDKVITKTKSETVNDQRLLTRLFVLQ